MRDPSDPPFGMTPNFTIYILIFDGFRLQTYSRYRNKKILKDMFCSTRLTCVKGDFIVFANWPFLLEQLATPGPI